MPSAPSASKNASCGFTPTTYGATASTSPQQKRVNACAACSRPRCASPRTSTGRRSGRGSSPTRSWLRLRSTASATRSPKRAVATARSAWSSCVIGAPTLAGAADKARGPPRHRLRCRHQAVWAPHAQPSEPTGRNGRRDAEGRYSARPSAKRRRARTLLVAGVPAAARADGLLQLAAGGEARNRRRRNLDLLARVARVHALTCRAPLRRELAEPGERDLLPALQGLGDRLQKGVDGLSRIAPRQIGLRCDLVYELLLSHWPLLPSSCLITGARP